MAKPDRSAPRRAAENPAEQGAASGAEQAETAAAGSAPQQDRAPSGRVRPKRASSRRVTRTETEAARAKVQRSEQRAPKHAAAPAPTAGSGDRRLDTYRSDEARPAASAESPAPAEDADPGQASAPRRARQGEPARAAAAASAGAGAGGAASAGDGRAAVGGGTSVKTKTEAPAEPRPARPVRPAKPQRAARRPSWVEASSGPGAPLTAKQDRERATMAHFGVAVGFVAPLALWLLYRDRGPFTAQEAKEALNFAVPPTLLMGVFFFLGQLPVLGPVFAIIGALIWMVMAFYGILGGSQVNKGRPYRYPFNLRILR